MELRGLEPLTFCLPCAALSQLSYSPELVIGSHCNAGSLVVPGGREPQMELRLPGHDSAGR